MKKFLFKILVAVIIALPLSFVLSGCGTKTNNDANVYDETYSGDYYSVDSDTSVLSKYQTNIQYSTKTNNFILSMQTITGTTICSNGFYSINGNILFNNEGTTKSIKLTGYTGNLDNTFLGKIIYTSGDGDNDISMMLPYISSLLEVNTNGMFNNLVEKKDNYVVLNSGDKPMILYKNGTTKLEENEILKAYTDKEEAKALSFATIIQSESNEIVYPYADDEDYVVVKDTSIDLTNSTQKQNYLAEESIKIHIMKTSNNCLLSCDNIAISDISGLDLKTTGIQQATISYKSNDKTYSKNVKIKVVDSTDDLPNNSISQIKQLYNKSAIVPNAPVNTEVYDIGLKIKYYFYNNESSTAISVNQLNMTGKNPDGTDPTTPIKYKIEVSGYDKTVAGFQEITITYRGKSLKQLVYLTDSTHNPVVGISQTSTAKLTITKKTVDNNTTYTADFSNATIQFKLLNGTVVTKLSTDADAQDVKITESNIIDLKDYSEYSTVETVNCSYNVNIDGNDYTFYFILNVNFVDADKV